MVGWSLTHSKAVRLNKKPILWCLKWLDHSVTHNFAFMYRCSNTILFCLFGPTYFSQCFPCRHRAINLFLYTYCREWLTSAEHSTHHLLTEELLDHQDYLALQKIRENDMKSRHEQKQLSELGPHIDPLSQLFKMLQRLATTGEQ